VIKSICKYLIIFLPVLILLVSVNCYADPANILWANGNIAKAVSTSILNGNDTYVLSGNIDEREARKFLVMDMPNDIDCLAVGPSLIMCVSSEMVGTDSFMNLGESGADYYDILNTIGQLDVTDKLPKTMILCVDTLFFDKANLSVYTRWTAQKEYSEYFLQKMTTGSATIINGSINDNNQNNVNIIKQFEQLFSLSYFQSSINYLLKDNTESAERIGVVSESGYDGAFWRADGSYVYTKEYQENSIEKASEYAKLLLDSQDVYLSLNDHIDSECKAVFEQLIDYLQANDVEVIFYLSPYHPIVWDEIETNYQTSLPIELETYISEYANGKNIRIIGAYDPEKAGVDATDFYDGRHMRAESLMEHFDFSVVK